jgi:hypothetical protein
MDGLCATTEKARNTTTRSAAAGGAPMLPAQQLGQLGEINCHPARFVTAQQIRPGRTQWWPGLFCLQLADNKVRQRLMNVAFGGVHVLPQRPPSLSQAILDWQTLP